jgi:hypothetical protein
VGSGTVLSEFQSQLCRLNPTVPQSHSLRNEVETRTLSLLLLPREDERSLSCMSLRPPGRTQCPQGDRIAQLCSQGWVESPRLQRGPTGRGSQEGPAEGSRVRKNWLVRREAGRTTGTGQKGQSLQEGEMARPGPGGQRHDPEGQPQSPAHLGARLLRLCLGQWEPWKYLSRGSRGLNSWLLIPDGQGDTVTAQVEMRHCYIQKQGQSILYHKATGWVCQEAFLKEGAWKWVVVEAVRVVVC